MSNQDNNLFDLGSDPVDGDFDPFATDDELNADDANETSEQQAKPVSSLLKQAETGTSANAPATKEPKLEHGLSEKPPVFEYAGATEDIEDTSKTFEELRIEKSDHFPELEDGKKVSWTVEYGKITKAVADPKGTSIGKVKSDIEASKEFTESLKKAKDKAPVCKVKPRVTAQSKGLASAYRGVFTNICDAMGSGKAISIVPAKDGSVYEIRNTEMGKFITPVAGCDMLSDVKAGFIPALPRIPMDMVVQVVSFFRSYMLEGTEYEALVNIFWDKANHGFFIDTPNQSVTKASVQVYLNEDYSCDRYIHYMDIHSHNSMKAFFSATDDADEKATRLYTVIGELHKYFPSIKTRISNGGKFWPINPSDVFELVSLPFPDSWKDSVYIKSPHKSDMPCFVDRAKAL